MKGILIACVLIAVVLYGARGGGAQVEDPMPFPMTCAETVSRYGRWIDWGPRVVDESGSPIAGVTVTFICGDASKRCETAEDGRIPVGGYLSQARLSLDKRGFYSIPDHVITIGGRDANKDIRMRHVEHPHPMKSIDLSL